MAIDVGSAVGYLDLDISGFLNGLRNAQNEAQNTSTTITGKLDSVGTKLTSVGTKLTATVTAPIVGLGTSSVKTAANFESAMSKVSAISGATGDDLSKLNTKAKEMGASTKFSATESAEAFQYMAMAGWKTEDMLDGISGIMDLAAADGLDLATTSDIVTDALTAFGLKAEDAGHFADVLATASSSANTNVSMLGESFKYVAPLAGTMGYSVEDTATALGLMANSGIKASQAGTTLRTAITRMIKPTDAIQSAMDELGITMTNDDGSMKSLSEVMDMLREKLNPLTEEQVALNYQMAQTPERMGHLMDGWDSLTESEKKYKTELSEGMLILEAMSEAELKEVASARLGIELNEERTLSMEEYDALAQQLGRETLVGLTDSMQAQNAATIFGQQALSGMLAIVTASEDDYNNLANAIDNADGKAKQMADTMIDNLSGQVTILKSQIEGLAIQIGNIMMPTIKKMVDKIQSFAEWLSKLSTEQQEMIVKIGLIVAAVGPLLLIIGKVIVSISNIIKMVQTLKMVVTSLNATVAANPIILKVAAIIAIVSALIALFVHLYKTNEDFRNKVDAAWEKIKEVMTKVVEAMKNAWKSFVEYAVPVIQKAIEIIKDLIPKIKDAIINTIEFLKPKIMAIIEFVKMVFEKIRSIITAIIEKLKPLVSEIIDTFKMAWETIQVAWEKAKPFFEFIWNVIKNIFSGTASFFGKIFSAAWDKIQKIWEKVAPFFKGVWEAIKKIFSIVGVTLKSFFEAAWEAIKAVWDVAVKYFTLIWAGIKAVFAVVKGVLSGDFSDAYAAIQNVWDKAVAFFQSIWDGIKSIFSVVIDWFRDIFTLALEAVYSVFEPIVNWFADRWKGIQDKLSKVDKWFSDKFKSAYDNVTKIWDKSKKYFSDKWEDIKKVLSVVADWFKDMFKKAYDNVTSIWNKAKGYFKSVWDDIVQVLSVVADWFKEMFQKAYSNMTDIWDKAKAYFKSIWDGIVEVLSGIAEWFKNMFQGAYNNVTDIWNNIRGYFSDRWQDVQNIFSGVGNWFKDRFQEAYNNITGVFSNIRQFFSDVWDNLWDIFWDIGVKVGDSFSGAFKGIVNGVFDWIEGKINWFFDMINNAIDYINEIPGVDIGHIDHVSFPRLAKGGLAYAPTIAMVGDNKNARVDPEVISPLSKLKKMILDAISVPINNIMQVQNKIVSNVVNNQNIKTLELQTAKIIQAQNSIISDIKNNQNNNIRIINFSPMITLLDELVEINKSMQNFETNSYYRTDRGKAVETQVNVIDTKPVSSGDTYIFNSPKTIDEIEAAKQIKKVKKEIAEGF